MRVITYARITRPARLRVKLGQGVNIAVPNSPLSLPSKDIPRRRVKGTQLSLNGTYHAFFIRHLTATWLLCAWHYPNRYSCSEHNDILRDVDPSTEHMDVFYLGSASCHALWKGEECCTCRYYFSADLQRNLISYVGTTSNTPEADRLMSLFLPRSCAAVVSSPRPQLYHTTIAL